MGNKQSSKESTEIMEKDMEIQYLDRFKALLEDEDTKKTDITIKEKLKEIEEKIKTMKPHILEYYYSYFEMFMEYNNGPIGTKRGVFIKTKIGELFNKLKTRLKESTKPVSSETEYEMKTELKYLQEFESVLINTKMEDRSQRIEVALIEIEEKIPDMEPHIVSLYTSSFSSFVNLVNTDPIVIQYTTPEIRSKIAELFRKLAAASSVSSAQLLSSLPDAPTIKKMPNELIILNELLYDTKIDMKTKSDHIQNILGEIEKRIIHMDHDDLSLYYNFLERVVDYIMKDPDGKQRITPETRFKIAMLYEKLEAFKQSKTHKTVELPKYPEYLQRQKEKPLMIGPKQVSGIIGKSPDFVDKTREDIYVKYLLSTTCRSYVIRESFDERISGYYKTKHTSQDKVMFIYIRYEEQFRGDTRFGHVGWVMIYWNATINHWDYVGLDFDPIIEFNKKSGKSSGSMCVLKDRKIPSEADYFYLLRDMKNPGMFFKNNVYEKMLGRGIRDSSGEYKILINQLTDSKYESYENTIDIYHRSQATDRNKIIFIEYVKEDKPPVILMTFWSDEGRWVSFDLYHLEEFIRGKFELNESYEPLLTTNKNLTLEDNAKRYEEKAKTYKVKAITYKNIFQALASGDKDVVNTLLVSNPSIVNTISSKGNTPLIYFIKNIQNIRNIDRNVLYHIIILLLDIQGIDLDYVDLDGRTALHLALINKLPNNLIRRLVGSNINLPDRYGYTALDYAAQAHGPKYINVKLLLILGASPKLNDTIKVSENVRKIITAVAKESPLHETKGMLNEEELQNILFRLYGFEINNPNINPQVSIAVAMKLFKDEFSLPVAGPPYLSSKSSVPDLRPQPVPAARASPFAAAAQQRQRVSNLNIGDKALLLETGIPVPDVIVTIRKIKPNSDGSFSYYVDYDYDIEIVDPIEERDLQKITGPSSPAPGGYYFDTFIHHCY